MAEEVSRYRFKPDAYSSHSVILRWLEDGGGRRLLDVGAADGLLSRPFTERGWRVTGIECDPAAAQAGARWCEHMVVANLDRAVPRLESLYDAIVYGDVLEHLADPLRVLSELNRCLAPGGVVVASVPNVAHFVIRLSLLVGKFEYIDRGILDHTHLRFFTERSLRALVADAGLTVERFTATPAPLYQVLPARFHRPWLAATHRMNAWLAHSLPRLLGYQFIVLARPKEAHASGPYRPMPAVARRRGNIR
ncbi:MAG: class I SAM-dependent methyltransferase [Candidatus Rokubacteria bacterium]|nr:class I SAM-dependent methyltransferase [Candidatus Rokubacteria bacterium]